MKTLTFIAFLALSSVPAFADFSFSCGEGHEKGAAAAEIGFVDSPEAGAMKLILKGEEQADEKLGFKPTEDGLWTITQDLGEKEGTRSWEFSSSNSSVQEFATSAKGKTRKVGARKKCDYVQTKSE